MKHIRIEAINKLAIEAALLEVNEGAVEHTLSDFADVERLAEDVEDEIVRLVGSKKRAVGARVTFTSGESVARSYSHKRIATELVIERRSAAWFLTSVKRAYVSIYGGGQPKLFLTPEQDEVAVARVRSAYTTMQRTSPQEA